MGQSGKTPLRRRQTLLRLVMGLIATVSIMVLYLWQPSLLRQADRRLYDAFLVEIPPGTPSSAPAIIDIDEASLHSLGQWPWPRHLVARLIERLTEGGAAAIGLDILLAEPDRTSPVHVQEELRQRFGVHMGFSDLPETLMDNDILLAKTLRKAPVVMGMYTRFLPIATHATTENTTTENATPPNKAVGTNAHNVIPLPADLPRWEMVMERKPADVPDTAPPPRHFLHTGLSATLPLPAFWQAAPFGSLNVAPDPDGVVRTVPLLTQVSDTVIPSLALRTLMRGLNTKTIILESGPDGLAAVRVGKYVIPVNPFGTFQVPFRGSSGMYPYFSAADILEGRVPAQELKGRIFFIGTSAPGLVDIRTTPFDAVYPGVEVHAAVIDAVLSNRFIHIPEWVPGAQMLAMACIGLLGTLAFSLAPATVYLPLLLLLAGGSIGISWHLFTQGIFISPVYATLLAVVLAVVLLAVRFWQTVRQQRLLRQAFSRYVAPDMVARIAERGEAVLAGEEREVTLMFTDIRGFTSLSEKLAPAQVVAVLNRYFTPMTALIRNSGGTVDKFIGDAIMAFWNAPLDILHHELHAVRAALAMQTALTQLNVELQNDFDITLRMGVGVHTGKVYVGNMGSAELLDYTCIGDTVNLSSRLEGLCPVYGVNAVVSAETATRCAAYTVPSAPLPVFVPLDSIRVKGKTQPVEICTPLPPEEAAARHDELQTFAKARQHYADGAFAIADKAFASLHQHFPSILLYELYAQRTTTLLQSPPPQWDGVWTFTKK